MPRHVGRGGDTRKRRGLAKESVRLLCGCSQWREHTCDSATLPRVARDLAPWLLQAAAAGQDITKFGVRREVAERLSQQKEVER